MKKLGLALLASGLLALCGCASSTGSGDDANGKEASQRQSQKAVEQAKPQMQNVAHKQP